MEKENRVIFFDLLRCVAAVAVIAIHVLAPYREQFGVIPDGEWLTAVSVNGSTRWAVPVFILISGALLLSDHRPFELSYYLKRRLGKVVIPFVVWSVFYGLFSGLSAGGFDSDVAQQTLANSPHHATYYHLGFFYYFIPLYFVIPFLQWLNKQVDDAIWVIFVGIWLVTTVLYLMHIDGPWSTEIWLYTGYLPLGYLLFKKVPITPLTVVIAVVLGITSLYFTVHSVVELSVMRDKYSVGRWLSYKTINVVLAASMIFILGRVIAPTLPHKAQQCIAFISKYSLGIYLLHPIFLWPMKEFGWYQGHPGWVIPLWVLIAGAGSLAMSWMFSHSTKTNWLLP
ncbi:acyltransferase family protein [Vibrio sp. CAIM 722]|uniref:Acyltransferase family protein n=1 Tax=Vibrio eleionomae TaxID=2653505 RepID=A0A7X4RV22_9VIBR|nr:acyltransferase [Vibrio eleionomae]MZI94491.1 acyltransferase family protein [Vibrio eleionomae]